MVLTLGFFLRPALIHSTLHSVPIFSHIVQWCFLWSLFSFSYLHRLWEAFALCLCYAMVISLFPFFLALLLLVAIIFPTSQLVLFMVSLHA